MAKGQKRSSRELRKPKQENALPKPESAFSNQIRLAANASAHAVKARVDSDHAPPDGQG